MLTISTLQHAYWNYQHYTMSADIINRTPCMLKLSTLHHVYW
jgi:hypothetical protein